MPPPRLALNMGLLEFLLPVLWLLHLVTQALGDDIQSNAEASLFSGLAENHHSIYTGNDIFATNVTGFSYDWRINFPSGTNITIYVFDGFEDGGSTNVQVSILKQHWEAIRKIIHECRSFFIRLGEYRTTAVSGSQPTSATSFNFSGDSLDVGGIAGGVAGGVVGILFLVLVFWCCRRQKKDEATPATPATPSALEGARPQPVVRGSSTKKEVPHDQTGYTNAYVPQMGYASAYGDKHMSQPSTQGMSQPAAALPQRRQEIQSSFAELPVGYEQNTVPQRMVVNNPNIPSWQDRQPAVEEQGWTRTTTTPDSKTVMNWEPPLLPLALRVNKSSNNVFGLWSPVPYRLMTRRRRIMTKTEDISI
ncbi:hypothetical protein B0H13DRAFT_1868556 [Mycena leptocephala]|nr:hypothetical protein B0H13DRAFT_1868556 [Mycena leptocephala]